METVWQDVRYSFRLMCKKPGFTAVVVVILAVAIGTNTSIFSVVNAVMLRPLPYESPHRLVRIQQQNTPWKEGFYYRPNFALLREQNKVFESLAGYCFRSSYVVGIEKSREVGSYEVSWNLLSMLGIQPMLGRSFLPEDEKSASAPVVVLSHAFWQNDLGGVPDIIGKSLGLTHGRLNADVETILNHQRCTIVGVMPPGFGFPVGRSVPFWIPMVQDEHPEEFWPSPVVPLARLKKGVTLEQADAELAALARRLRSPDSSAEADNRVVYVQRLLDRIVEGHRTLPLLLLGAAGFVLLIACSNVANLFLARATGRTREMAMRLALGASRRRVMRQMLTESLLVSLAAGVLGLALTCLTIKGLVRLCPSDIPRLQETRVDLPVLAFTLAASVLTGLVFGMMPAWRASGRRVSDTLKQGVSRTTSLCRWRHVHSGLVVSQLGLSLILLIGAALLIRSLIALGSVDLGFRPENVLAVNLALPEAKYQESHRRTAFFDTLLERLRTLPQIRSAAMICHVDSLTGERMAMPISVPGRTGPEEEHTAQLLDVSSDFFETMGIKLLRGRTFADQEQDEGAVIIDKTLATRHFPDSDPVGRTLLTAGQSERRIIGVVDTMTDFLMPEPTQGLFYLHGSASTGAGVIVVRTDADPIRLAPLIRDQVAQLEKDQVIKTIEPLEATLSQMLAPRRFVVILLGVFAAIALTLATVGVYGLLQYSTAQQTHDIGIRMALGADGADVRRRVLGRGLKLTLFGIAIGIAGAIALTRVLSSLLYDVTPTDPLTLACVSIVLGGIAMVGSYLPARRAARIDPMEALRYE